MFEKYGEFDSAEELNVAAATALEQGDTDAVIALAKENGIEEEDARDYIEAFTSELCTPLMAAIGKLSIERKAIDLPTFMDGWVSLINDMLADNTELTAAVRKKGKKLTDLLGKLMGISSENRKKVPAEIVKAAGMSGNVFVGDVDVITFKQTVIDFYTK